MIQQTTRKIHFSEYIPTKGREKDIDKPPTVRVNVKSGSLNLSTRTLSILGLDGQFIKLFYEPTRKIIGFTKHSGLSNEQVASKKYRLVKPNSSGQSVVSVMGILKTFAGLQALKYKCEIKKYVEMDGIMNKGTTYYYIQLEDSAPVGSVGSLNGVDVRSSQQV